MTHPLRHYLRCARPGPRFRRLFLVALGTLLCTLCLLYWLNPTGADFFNLFATGHAAAQGQIASIYDTSYMYRLQEGLGSNLELPEAHYQFLYPPIFALLFAPFAFLPYTAARLLFGALSLVCLAASVPFARRLSNFRMMDCALLLLLWGSLYMALAIGQLSVFLLLLITVITAWSLENKHPLAAGLLAGLLVVKPYFLLLLGVAWLFAGRWRSLAGMALTAGAAAAASYLISPNAFTAYLTLAPTNASVAVQSLNPHQVNATLYSLLAQVLQPPVAAYLAAITGLAVLLVLAVCFRRGVSRYHYAALWAALALISPWLGHYDLLLLIVPVWLLAPTWRRDTAAVIACALLWLGVAASVVAPTSGAVLADLLLFGFCVWRGMRGGIPVTKPVTEQA